MSAESQCAPSAQAWRSALGLLLLILIAPLLLVDVPPLVDYPNHLARMFVLAHPQDPGLSRMYVAHWDLLPNLAIDLLVPALMRVMPVYWAGKLMLASCILLPVTGAIAYSRALFGVRSYWQILAGLAAYNGLLLMGFMNFEFAVGAALWLAAGWVRFRPAFPRSTVIGVAVLAVPLFFFHIFGLLFLSLLLASHEAFYVRSELQHGPAASAILHAGLRLAAVFAVPSILLLSAPFTGTAGQASWLGVRDKAVGIFTPFFNYVPALDFVTGLCVLGVVGSCLLSPRSRVSPPTLLCLAAIAAAYAAAPFSVKDGEFIDSRFPVMAGFLLFAGFIPGFAGRWTTRAVFALLATLFLVRMAVLDVTWARSTDDVSLLRQAIAPVRPGQRVLAVDVTTQDSPQYWRRIPLSRHITHLASSYWHLPALLVIEQKAFWQGEFALPSQQPWRVQPAYRDASAPAGRVTSYRDLESKGISADTLREMPFLADWRGTFDYVLVENAGGLPDPGRFLPDDLELLVRNDMAALYRIRKHSVAR